MLKAQIKFEFPGINETDLMFKCLRFFQDQFQSSFQSQSMNSAKNSKENNYVIAGEG